MFVTYLHSRNGKPHYVGEGTLGRAFSPCHPHKTRKKNGHSCTMILCTSSDKTTVRLIEQSMISWLGIETLANIQPFFDAGTKQHWMKMGPKVGHKQSQQTCDKKKAAHAGKRWWTNGTEHTQSKECPGDGWHLGRLPNKKIDRRTLAKQNRE